MPIPVIDPESSVLAYPQWMPWEHIFSATNLPTAWGVTSGGVPIGMSFEPVLAATGDSGTGIITAVGHTYQTGNVLMFRELTGGSGLATATLYYVRDVAGATFKLAATANGAALALGSDISAANIFRPGELSGAAILPGIYSPRLTATNGDGTSDSVLFVIGIEPAALAPDSHLDVTVDVDSGAVAIVGITPDSPTQTNPNPALIRVKENDDLMMRIFFQKSGTTLDLPLTSLKFGVKEFEPDGLLDLSDDAFAKIGVGTNTCYLLHVKFNGPALAGSLSDYEDDQGTFFLALTEIERIETNAETIGPATLTRTSQTFGVRIDRDLIPGG